MKDPRSHIYWLFGGVSVAFHAALLYAVMEGVDFFGPTKSFSAQPVELVALPEGIPDPLLPLMATEPEPVAEPPAPEPEPPAPEPPPPEPEPVVEEPPAPPPEVMAEPNKVKVVKKEDEPTPVPRPTPRATANPAARRATPGPTRPATSSVPVVQTPLRSREVKFSVGSRAGVPNGFDSSAAMSFDNVDFNFAYYATSIRTKLQNNFIAPPNAFTSGRRFETTVFFVIGKNGELLESRIDKGSGFRQFDEAALRSVLVSVPFPPLPVNFRGVEVGIYLRFVCGRG